MLSFFLELVGIGSIAGGCYAKWGPDGYAKRLAQRLGCDVWGAIAEKKD